MSNFQHYVQRFIVNYYDKPIDITDKLINKHVDIPVKAAMPTILTAESDKW